MLFYLPSLAHSNLLTYNPNSREILPIENKERENIALMQRCENFEECNSLNLVLFISQ